MYQFDAYIFTPQYNVIYLPIKISSTVRFGGFWGERIYVL